MINNLFQHSGHMVWDTNEPIEDKEDKIHMQRIPLTKSKVVLDEFIERAASVVYHVHYPTCYKNGHLICRMGYPRLLVKKSFPLDKKRQIHMFRRSNGNLVPFCRGLLLANPCNHSMNLTCHGERYARELQLYKDHVNTKQNDPVSVANSL